MGVGGLATSDLGDRVGQAVQTSVCRIVDPSCGTDDDGPPAPVTRNRYGMAIAPRAMNADGPGMRPDWLDFGRPGSSSFTYDRGKGLRVRLKQTGSTSLPTPDASGCRMVTSTSTGTFQVVGGGGGGRASGELFRGKDTSFAASLGPDHARRVRDRSALPPNPFDPRTLAPGESTTMTADSYKGLGLNAPVSALQASLGDQSGSAVASTVTRVDDKKMRLTVGNEKYLQRSAGLGIAGVPINVSGSDKLSAGQSRSVDVDISTDAGWKAYQSFVQEGKLPKGGRGVSNPGTSKAVKTDSSAEAGLDAGPLKATTPVGSSGFTVEESTTNGSTTTTRTWRQGDYNLQVVEGKGGPRFVVMAAGADKGELANFRAQQGLPPGRPNDLRLEFTGPEMMQLVKDAKLTDSSTPSDDVVYRDLRNAKTPLDGLIALAGASTSKNGTSAVAGLGGITTRIAAAARRKGAKGVDGKLGGREPRVRCPR